MPQKAEKEKCAREKCLTRWETFRIRQSLGMSTYKRELVQEDVREIVNEIIEARESVDSILRARDSLDDLLT